MKKCIALLMAVTGACSVQAQTVVNGTVNVNAVNGEKMYLQKLGHRIDSVIVKDGKYQLRDNDSHEPHYYEVNSDKFMLGMFWAENCTLNLNTTENSFTTTGSPIEDEYQAYKKWMKPVLDEERQCVREGKAMLAKGDVAGMKQKESYLEGPLRLKEDSIFMEFCKKYPKSHVCLNHIYNCRVMSKYGYERYMKMLRMLDTSGFHGKQWETMKDIMSCDAKTQPGQMMPDFPEPNVFGKVVKASDFRGKYLFITICSTGLADYVADLPVKKELYASLRDKGFEILDVMLESKKEAIVKSIAENGQKWNLVSGLKSWEVPYLHEYKFDHIPQTFLVGPDGRILARNIQGNDIKTEIHKHIK